MNKTPNSWDSVSKRWLVRPYDLPDCPHGPDIREWHIQGVPTLDNGKPTTRSMSTETGTHYRNQLWCRHKRTFVNPSGVTCQICLMPDNIAERMKKHREKMGKKAQNTPFPEVPQNCVDCTNIKKCCGGRLKCEINNVELKDLESCPIDRWVS